jgi:hypothetical protein
MPLDDMDLLTLPHGNHRPSAGRSQAADFVSNGWRQRLSNQLRIDFSTVLFFSSMRFHGTAE